MEWFFKDSLNSEIPNKEDICLQKIIIIILPIILCSGTKLVWTFTLEKQRTGSQENMYIKKKNMCLVS